MSVSSQVPLSQRADSVVFYNGEYIPATQAHVGVMTHGLAYGTGIFEGIRGYWNADAGEVYLFRLREHFERMHRSAAIMQVKLPYSVDALIEIAAEVVRKNDLRENCYVRPFAFKSDEVIGVKLHGLIDHFTMYAVPMGDYVATTGLRCGVSSWRRVDDNMIPARAKITGAYVNSAFAKSEALQNGFDEAIMLTSEGHVSEGSAENIFLYIDGKLVTPPPTENILLGVTRDTLMELARRELGLTVIERQIDRTELYGADEILLTGTGAQIAPVIEVDHRPVGLGKIGPVGDALQQLYLDVVRGIRTEYMHWLTPVYGAATKPQRAPLAAAASNGNGHKSHSTASPLNGHAKSKPAARTRAATR